MKLITFEVDGNEKWGVLIKSEKEDRELILVPQMFEDILIKVCDVTSSHFYKKGTHFFKDGECPKDLTELLEDEDGLSTLARLKTFAEYILFVEDPAIRRYCTYFEEDVNVLAPITRPRRYYGLVQNSTSFLRNNPKRAHVNVYPQGHQRPITCAIGSSEYVAIERDSERYGFNVEVGVIIGKKGKNIQAQDAHKYIAGYTNVIDMQQMNMTDAYGERNDWDWYVGATASWMAKKIDTNCPIGPYLVTADEVTNLYNLDGYTYENGILRDKGHTSNTMIGIERFIEHFSSFCTIYPGDILHLGTFGVDGKWKVSFWDKPEDVVMEGEIEGFGRLKVPVKFVEKVWSSDSPEVVGTEPSSRLIREMLKGGTAEISDFKLNETNSFWTAIGNYRDCESVEGLKPISDMPRTLNNPASALTQSGEIELSARTTDVKVSAELCFVVKKVARKVSAQNAKDYILGFAPMVAFNDQSFKQAVMEPATPQESNLPTVYARWADETNIIGNIVPFDSTPISELNLAIEGIAKITVSTDEYICKAEQQLEFMTKYLTLMPGDVVSLGRLCDMIDVDTKTVENGFNGSLTVKGFETIKFSAKKEQYKESF